MENKKYRIERKNNKTDKIWTAMCEKNDNQYVVKAGSKISDIELKGLSKRIKKIRDSASINEDRTLIEDVSFENLNDAASFVLATNASGEREWKEIIE
ncbi:MAG: hypothetical protein SOZ71_10075 [Clostridium sp.]|nr:hypothetical protein [Clostridium sp.]